MPAEVVLPSPTTALPRTPSPPQPACSEGKSGSLTLVAMNGRRQGVNVKVYRTSIEHFAVLYPQKKMCRPLGVVNLRHTVVSSTGAAPNAFEVHQQGYDTPMTITFICDHPRERQGWVEAFTSSCTPTLKHQSSLPIVEEDEEM